MYEKGKKLVVEDFLKFRKEPYLDGRQKISLGSNLVSPAEYKIKSNVLVNDNDTGSA